MDCPCSNSKPICLHPWLHLHAHVQMCICRCFETCSNPSPIWTWKHHSVCATCNQVVTKLGVKMVQLSSARPLTVHLRSMVMVYKCMRWVDRGKLDAVQPQSICCVMCNMCNIITQCPTNIQYLVCTHGCVVAICVAFSCIVSNVARYWRRCNLGAVSRCS